MSLVATDARELIAGKSVTAEALIHVRGHNPVLDGLRGVAIALVLFHHLWPWLWSDPVSTGITRLSHISWIGVDLFFVLSGFLISGILLDSQTRPGYLKNFFARRTLRIFPLYYLFLFICFVVVPPFLSSMGVNVAETDNALWYWFYGTNYLWSVQAFNPPEYLGITWSLAVEEQFYLVWPLVILLFRRNLALAILVLIGVTIATRVWFVLSLDAWADATYMASVSRADSLLVGAAIALFAREERFNADYWQWASRSAVFICLPLVIAWQLALPGRNNPWFSAFGYTLLAVGLAGVLMHALSRQDSLLKHLLSHGVLQWLGRYSYGIYLYHMLIWYLSHQLLNAELMADGSPLHPAHFSPMGDSMLLDAALRFMACTSLTLLMAWVSFHVYEKQFLKLKHRF